MKTMRSEALKCASTPGPGFLSKGTQAWIPIKMNPEPGVDVYFWAAYEKLPWSLTKKLPWRFLSGFGEGRKNRNGFHKALVIVFKYQLNGYDSSFRTK